MKTGLLHSATAALFLGLAGLTLAQSGPLTGEYRPWDQHKAMQEAQQRIAAGRDPVPGPRTCFWARGPAAADPYLNIAYPDSATFYWAAVFTLPAGAKLHLEGQFPRARYISFISYNERGEPIESVADYLLKPEGGAVNPFRPGADRLGVQRGYRLEVVDASPPPNQPVNWTANATNATPTARTLLLLLLLDLRPLPDRTRSGRLWPEPRSSKKPPAPKQPSHPCCSAAANCSRALPIRPAQKTARSDRAFPRRSAGTTHPQ